ncbi:MAG TPA: protein phosphatase 2C domain-containing protein [Candidatus Hydrogenedentes bacterium]|nr:protein phosphatase 2C domain-containing protein [Candidatus Hydrogenedentota bacterium]HPG69802.1 protein phosphatase 2C domain-containing protein [Candidatus Hydrogenedentota bacterium]
MQLDIGALSDIGRRKKKNEDHFGVFGEDTPDLALIRQGALLIVADGLGGHIGGDMASKLAVSHFRDILFEPRPQEDPEAESPDAQLHALLEDRVRLVNERIHQTNVDLVKNGRPMGTTLCAALVEPTKTHIVNVGDSRAYHIRGDEIIARTEDHSWVDEQVRLGVMTRDEAEADHRRNLVTKSLGTQSEVDGDVYAWHTVPDDLLLLCSDGLVNMISDAEILAELKAGGLAQDIVQRLIDLANAHGGKDNITAILARIHPDPKKMARARLRRFLDRYGRTLLAVFGALAFGGLCFAAGFLTHMLLGR